MALAAVPVRGFAAAATAPTAVLLQLGDGSFSRFAHADALSLDRTALLEAVFGGKKTMAELGQYTVEATVSAERKPAAGAKWEPLEDITTLGQLWEQLKQLGSASLYLHVRVRLPSAPAAAAAATPALHEAQTMWRGLLASTVSVEDVRANAAAVAACTLGDTAMSVEQQASAWGSPVASILRRPIPYDRSSKDKPAVMLELLEPATPTADAVPLYERVWRKMQPSLQSTAQRTSMIMLTGVSGAGKTKVAFDIGREHAFVVLARMWEGGLMTPPWQLLGDITAKLQAQSVRGAGAAPLPVPESTSAVASLLLLLSCHLEWAVMVHEAAEAEAARTGSPADERTLREAILRAQRNGTGQYNVRALFARRLQEVLDSGSNMAMDGRVVVPVDAALARLRLLHTATPASMPVVWCYDEVQALLSQGSFTGFFEGTFDATAFQGAGAMPTQPPAVAAREATVTASAVADGSAEAAAPSTERPAFLALPDDIAACNAEIRQSCSRGWFYGLLVAVRLLVREFRWGHLLCGSSLRLNRELLLAHSPAQGVADSMDADTRFDVAALRSWLGSYLTPAAAAGLDVEALDQLAGRPLFGSCVFERLHGALAQPTAELRAADPAAVVRAAVQEAVEDATAKARTRVEELWGATFPTASGQQPHTLVAWLYYLQRMGFGSTTTITPPSMSAEVMDAVQRGVLHVGRSDSVINLRDEPITAAAILAVGRSRTGATKTIAEDSVVRALARRITGAFGDNSSKGNTAEDIIAWTLLRRSGGRTVALQHLLEPFLPSLRLFPASLADHTVQLDSGLACGVALGAAAAQSTFLELLARPNGHTLLLHHAQTTAAGADLAFLAQRPGAEAGSPLMQRLVLLQVKNAASASAADMLRSVDLGQWYPDTSPSVKGAKGKVVRDEAGKPVCETVETESHVALRRVLAAHPDWADPVRVLVSARPWAERTQLIAASVSAIKVPAQPVVLAQFSSANVGVDLGQGAAVAELYPPKDSLDWWPTLVRHWDSLKCGPHPQEDSLPLPPVTALALLPSRRVRFSVDGASSVPKSELTALARAAGVLERQVFRGGSLFVTFAAVDGALRAVADAEAGMLRVDGRRVSAVFVR